MKQIDDILLDINEDKTVNNTTTSNKFKKDLWEFFQGFGSKVAVEFGTHKGQTTKVLSYLFQKVYTINNNDNELGKKLNEGLTNITYLNFNLYGGTRPPIQDIVSVFLIDAGHKYENVISDFNLAVSLTCSEECYIIFDDYGCNVHRDEVKRAIDEMISAEALEVVREIGHTVGYEFGNNKFLEASEGLITKVIWH